MVCFRTCASLPVVFWKNCIIRKRHKIWFLCEAVIPVVLFILIAYARSQIKGYAKEKIIEPSYHEIESNYKTFERLNHDTQFYYMPNNYFVERLFDRVRVKLDLASSKFRGFSDEQSLLEYYKVHGVNGTTFAIIFNTIPPKTVPKHLFYDIRINERDLYWPTDTLFYNENNYIPDRGSDLYKHRGFMALQWAIDESFIEMAANKSIPYDITMQEFPYPPYIKDDGINELFQYFLPLVTLFSFMLLCPVVLKRVVEEKSTGIKELMKIMGLKQWTLWLGWLIHALIVNLISIIIIVILLKSKFGVEYPTIEYSDGTILFVFLLLYCTACILFCFAISTFFKNPNVALVFGILIWLLSYFVPQNYVIDQTKNSLQEWTFKMLLAFLPNVALTLGYDVISQYETREIGSQWNNLAQSASDGKNDVTMLNVLVMFVMEIIIYALVTLYIDNIKPGRYGIGRKWHYPITGVYKKISRTFCNDVTPDESEEQILNPKYFEESDGHEDIGIKITHLKKCYGSKQVLYNVNLKLYNGQISVLLGHNGAGKTTLMSIMTGLITSTSGDIYINNKNVKDDLDIMYESIGICPQHNMYFPDLTVKEHLIFFARLKGISHSAANLKAKDLLAKMNMLSRRNYYPEQISGGMKRKLNLAIALIGDPNILILDEPTSGMDYESRREIWDILLEQRKDKTILVSTHFMEEADTLGDRIAIMDHGNLICCGSPMFLRNAYEAGYYLTLSIACYNGTVLNSDFISQLQIDINTILPGTKLLDDETTGDRITFLLPNNSKHDYPTLLRRLEKGDLKCLRSVEIKNISVKNTSMEEVFLRAGYNEKSSQLNSRNEEKTQRNDTMVPISSSSSSVGSSPGCDALSAKCIAKIIKFLWLLISEKRWVIFKKKIWIHILQLLIAVIITSLTLYLGIIDPNYDANDVKPFHLRLDAYKGSVVMYSGDQNNPNVEKMLQIFEKLVENSDTQPVKVPHVSEAIIEKGVENILYYKQHLVIAAELNQSSDGRPILNAMYSNNALHGAPIAVNLIMNTVLQNLTNSEYLIGVSNKPLPPINTKIQREQSAFKSALLWIFLFPLGPLFLVAAFVIFPQSDNASYVKTLQYMCGLQPYLYWITIYIFDLLMYSVQLGVIMLVFFIFNTFLTDLFGGLEAFRAISSLCFVYGMCAIPLAYLFSYRKTSSSALSNYIIFGLITGVLLTTVVMLMEESQDKDWEQIGTYIYWISSLSPQFDFTYGCAIFVKQAVWNFNWNIMSEDKKNAKCNFQLNPCCGTDVKACEAYKSYFSGVNNVQPLLYSMISMSVFYLLILIVYDSRKAWFRKLTGRNDKLKMQDEPDNGGKIVLNASKIRKDYLPFWRRWTLKGSDDKSEILKGITLEVESGECYGLLGANGAGKSTTFRLLAGEELPSTGTIKLKKGNVPIMLGNIYEYQKEVGYCPQFDAINEDLTGRQMLSLFAALRNMHKEDVEILINKLGLEEFADIPTKKYSGGNKRKLNFGISVIGYPRLALLDEPTTGVDPVSRRKLWEIIKDVKKQIVDEQGKHCSMVFTSHSMDECEVLCDKLAILKDGVIQTHGTIPEIKKTHEKGFTIKIKTKPGSVTNIDGTDSSSCMVLTQVDPVMRVKNKGTQNPKLKKFGSLIQNMDCIDKHLGISCYRISESRGTRWSEIFDFMEELKSDNNDIADYTISNTTLEEVFLEIAKEKSDELDCKRPTSFFKNIFVRNSVDV